MKREAQRRKQRARERQECPVHSWQRHGKEAEELRKGVEDLLTKVDSSVKGRAEICRCEGLAVDMYEAYTELRDGLRSLLETVDARDSLAYLERCYPPPLLTHVACRDVHGTIWSLPRPFRHHDVLALMRDRGAQHDEDDDRSEGFLDASGRYLDREAALEIARSNGQLTGGSLFGTVLTSEDLW